MSLGEGSREFTAADQIDGWRNFKARHANVELVKANNISEGLSKQILPSCGMQDDKLMFKGDVFIVPWTSRLVQNSCQEKKDKRETELCGTCETERQDVRFVLEYDLECEWELAQL